MQGVTLHAGVARGCFFSPPPAVRPRWGGRMLAVAWMSIRLGWGAGGAEGDDDRWGGRVR